MSCLPWRSAWWCRSNQLVRVRAAAHTVHDTAGAHPAGGTSLAIHDYLAREELVGGEVDIGAVG